MLIPLPAFPHTPAGSLLVLKTTGALFFQAQVKMTGRSLGKRAEDSKDRPAADTKVASEALGSPTKKPRITPPKNFDTEDALLA